MTRSRLSSRAHCRPSSRDSGLLNHSHLLAVSRWLLAALALCSFASAKAQSDDSFVYVISTFAGSETQGSADGAVTGASFYAPRGAAVDAAGNVYVADSGNHKIRKISAAGVVTTLAGSGNVGSADGTGAGASFSSPYGVALDAGGNVYVADSNNHKIRKISPAGVVTTLAGSGDVGSVDGAGAAASFYTPLGIAVDAGGNVYVADTNNYKIRKISPAGVVTTLAGSGTQGSVDGTGAGASFYTPHGVAVDAGGNVYVVDTNNHKIRKISAGGVVTTLAGSGLTGSADGTGAAASFSSPRGVGVDAGGNVYVADSNNHKIRKISAGGVVTTLAGSGDVGRADGTGAAASFSSPGGVALDAGGNVYVADSANYKIRKISAAGVVTTFAGSGLTGSADGAGTAASFYVPRGVAPDAGGNVYVADTLNHKIRKISAGGVVTTLAGSGTQGSADGTGAAASFSFPYGVAVDAGGNVYVADSVKIRKISAGGVVTTLAGSGTAGSADGTGAGASFSSPYGVALDAGGNVYVADYGSHKIRKISAGGVVTTLAGSGTRGSVDGAGTAASFDYPGGVALDAGGNVYVADSGSHKIRKISPAGVVTTLAGSGTQGSADGTGAAASFNGPRGVAVDAGGNVYVADSNNNKIRKISAAGVVTTMAGSGNVGRADGTGAAAHFYSPHGVAVDAGGNVYVADSSNHKIRKGVRLLAQQITFSALSNKTFGDAPFSLSATASSGLAVTFSIVSGPATIAGNTVTLTGGGTVTVRASQAGNGSYAPAPSVDQTFTVQKASQTITFSALPNKAFGDAPFSLSATASSGLPVTFSIVSGPATVAGNTVTITGVGTVTVRASQAGNGSYAPAASVNQTFTVLASQTITFPGLSNKTFGDAPFSVSATASSGLPVTFSIVSGPATIAGNTVTLTGGGTVTVRASQAGNGSYAPASSVDQTFTVQKASQTITFSALPNKAFGDAPFSLSATASSGLAVTFSIVSGPATVAGNTVTITGFGTVTVRASQAGNASYTPAASVDQTFTVLASQTITFPTIGDRLMTSPTISLTGAAAATTTSGLAVTYTVVSGPATMNGTTLTLTGEGVVTVRASQAGNATYAPASSVDQTFTVSRVGQTITFPTIGDRLMTSPTISLTGAAAATTSSSLAVTYAVVSGPASVSGTTLTLTGAGTVTVSASQAGNTTYAPATVSQTFAVSRAAQTITWPTIGERVQGQAIPLSATASSNLSVTYTLVAGPALLSSGTLQLTGEGSVILRASQAGNAVYDPVSTEQTITVRANVASPTNLLLSPAWFRHTGVSGTVVGKLSAFDGDSGDVLTYTLVGGAGDTDNKHFRIVGDQLQTSSITDFQGRVALSIRVRAQDLAGNTLEAAMAVTRVESNPFVRFRQRGDVFYSPLGSDGFRPSYVNVIFQLKDITGRKGLNFPQELVDQDKELFIVKEGNVGKEDGVQIKESESFLQMGKIKNIPVKARTILLLDTSNSIGASLADIKTAAKGLVDNMFDQQEIAIYTFSAGPVMVAPFTSKSPGNSPENQQKLKEKIDAITLGAGTTNLYGSIIEMLNLKPRQVNGVLDPGWTESFSTDGIETTFLIVMTDGDHTAGLGLTVSDVLAARRINPDAGAAIENQKAIFTVGVGRDLNTAALNDIGSGGFKIADTVAQLSSVFAEVQSDILNEANSFYWANYASPKFGNYEYSLTVELRGNSNTEADRRISTTFTSNRFKPVEKGLYINRNSQKVEGVTREDVLKDTPEIAYAFTVLPPVGTPAYTWSIANPELASLTPGGANGNRVTITPNNLDGTTKLKVRDTVNNMEREIDLVFGSGKALPAQTINFAAIPYKLVTAAPFTLSATASSGLPVAYSVASGPATLGSDGRTLTLTGVGTVTVVATQAGNANFAPAQPVTRTFNVTEAPVSLTPQTITFDPMASRTFGDAPFELVATASSGLPVTFSVVSGPATLGVNGTTLTLTGAGTVIIRAAQAGNATYAAATAVDRSFVVTSGTQGDSDDDGVDDAWELTWFGNLTTAGIATDSDGDGFSDVEEFLRDLDPTAETAFTNQPDVAIGFGSKRLIGRDVYDSRGVGQVAEASVDNRKTKTCLIEIRNGGTARSSFKVLGNGSTENFRVRYMVGTLDVTKKVVAGTYVVKSLAPGKSKILKVLVTVGKKAEAEETFAVNVDLVSDVDPEARDRATYNVIVK